VHRWCPPGAAHASPDDGAVEPYGAARAAPAAAAGAGLVLAALALAAAGLVRVGPSGLVGLAAAALTAQLVVIVALRPRVAACTVRRSVMGAVTQISAAAGLWALSIS